MKDHSLGISISLLFHALVVLLLLRVPLDQFIKSKTIIIDFTLEKGQIMADSQGTVKNKGHKAAKLQAEKAQQKETAGKTELMTNTQLRRGIVDKTVSDQVGQVLVQDEKVLREAEGGVTNEKSLPAGQSTRGPSLAPGTGKVIDYSKGSADAKDFPFITDTVQKRFKGKYPDRARRMGWEGKVLLSFVILENGAIRDVEVINSSGRRDFDDHAREILEKTIFNRQLPYRLQVRNWLVTYRLQ
jgi:protein TonB